MGKVVFQKSVHMPLWNVVVSLEVWRSGRPDSYLEENASLMDAGEITPCFGNKMETFLEQKANDIEQCHYSMSKKVPAGRPCRTYGQQKNSKARQKHQGYPEMNGRTQWTM